MAAIDPTLCMPCHQAKKSTHPKMWHQQCPGRFGRYAGLPEKQCTCDCAWSRKWRGDR